MTDNAAEAQTILKWMEIKYREFATHPIDIDDANQLRADLTIHANMATAHALLAIADALTQPVAGTCTAVSRIEYAPGDRSTYGCRHPHGHTGAHQDPRRITTWLDNAEGATHLNAEPQICDKPRPDEGDYQYTTACILKAGHDTNSGTPHTDTDGDTWPSQNTPPICGHPNPDSPDMLCTDVPNHYGVHDHLRIWWPNDTYPVGAGVCIATGCHLYGGHPGDHYTRSRPDHTEELPW